RVALYTLFPQPAARVSLRCWHSRCSPWLNDCAFGFLHVLCQGGAKMVAAVKVDTQRVGALPVIAEFCNRLQLADIVNTHVPWAGEVPLGDIVEILVANR